MAPRREDLGSWLEGTAGDPEARAGLGLPETGPGSMATLPRRLAGVLVDWMLSLGVSGLLFPADAAARGFFAGAPLATVAVFGVSSAILVGLLGHTVGHRVVGLRVVRVRDLGTTGGAVRPPGLLAGLVRSALLCLVIPAVVWDTDGRGLHDTAAGTVLVRR